MGLGATVPGATQQSARQSARFPADRQSPAPLRMKATVSWNGCPTRVVALLVKMIRLGLAVGKAVQSAHYRYDEIPRR